MIKELLNDLTRLDEQLLQNKKEEGEILALLGIRARELLKVEWKNDRVKKEIEDLNTCLLYTSPSPRDQRGSRMPSSA